MNATRIQSIESDRLLLRMWSDSDLDAYADMVGNADVMRYLGDGQPLTRTEAWRHMALVVGHWQLRGFGLWAAEDRRTGQLIGRVGFWQPEGWPGFELGWTLRRQFWGRGYATEAALLAIDFAFNRLKRDRVISLIHPQNGNSIAVAVRLGMALEGEDQINGRQACRYALTRGSWATK